MTMFLIGVDTKKVEKRTNRGSGGDCPSYWAKKEKIGRCWVIIPTLSSHIGGITSNELMEFIFALLRHGC